MPTHDIVWTKPAPFWSDTTEAPVQSDREEFQKPGILRFASDTFMEDFLNVLATDPKRLGEYRVRPETWRGFHATADPVAPAKAHALPFQRLGFARRNLINGRSAIATRPPSDAQAASGPPPPLKLYQPAHQRYYLVTSCLVCRTPGLPDRKVDTAHQQRVGFLMRRTFKGEPGVEYAWVKSANRGFAWIPLTKEKNDTLVEGEDVLPMFAVNFTSDDLRARRLFAGLIPAGKREAYLAGPKGSPNNPAPGGSDKTARKILFRTEVAEPWKALVTLAAKVGKDNPFAPASDKDEGEKNATRRQNFKNAREQIQTASWFILHDLLRYLKTYLPNVYHNVVQTPNAPTLTGNEPQLFDFLGTLSLGSDLKTALGLPATAFSMRDALKAMKPIADAGTLDKITVSYDRAAPNSPWPTSLLFPLADPQYPAQAPIPTSAPSSTEATEIGAGPEFVSDLNPDPANVDVLTAKIILALDPNSTTPAPAIPPTAIAPADSLAGTFVIRCLYERPTCGPLHKDIVSPPSEEFLLAGFFDPDAPARPIRIGLPIDTTPAGLRKFDKNTAFVMSDILCGQIKRMKGITFGDLVMSILPWPFHRDISAPDKGPCQPPGMGTICSLSIPIITLCALILLMIIVSLLDFIFRWMPFLIVCFPLPKLLAKPPP
jgi:hypothetical protein